MNKALEFAKDVKSISRKYNLSYFFVTEGASCVDDKGCEAVKLARRNHVIWEIENNIDPNHEWE